MQKFSTNMHPDVSNELNRYAYLTSNPKLVGRYKCPEKCIPTLCNYEAFIAFQSYCTWSYLTQPCECTRERESRQTNKNQVENHSLAAAFEKPIKKGATWSRNF